MEKLFYIVMMTYNEKPILLATLSYDGVYYSYKPYNIDTCKIPRITKEFKRKTPPHLLLRRTYSEGRPDLSHLLDQMGLKKYDLWTMVELTEGTLETDDIKFLTIDGLRKRGLEYLAKETSAEVYEWA
ncbi:hypothetical protein [Paenibacillus sp. SYP-B4298]|uniref:hypothetical protein n=1 Tax=Paenibacillus sp. SYP-B4298 TaxID=2996034 RepID=UPI0022DD57D1|nr:hypothetical protein [Paenibacillus sp. SYP-B4298]